MEFSKLPKIGVFGSAGGSELERLSSSARKIGRQIALRNCILVTGACFGLPHEAALGANEVGGICLGFSPAMNFQEHVQIKFPASPYVLVFTGFEKKGRNVISTRTCDAAIYLSGRTGTLSEFSMFYDEATGYNVIGLLKGSGGCIDFLTDFIGGTEKRSKAEIIVHEDPVVLVHKVYEALLALNAGRFVR